MHRLRHRFLCSDLFSNGRFLPIQSLTILAPFLPFSVVPTPFDGRFRFCRFFPAGVFYLTRVVFVVYRFFCNGRFLPIRFLTSIVFIPIPLYGYFSNGRFLPIRSLTSIVFIPIPLCRYFSNGRFLPIRSLTSIVYTYEVLLCTHVLPTVVFYRSDRS